MSRISVTSLFSKRTDCNVSVNVSALSTKQMFVPTVVYFNKKTYAFVVTYRIDLNMIKPTLTFVFSYKVVDIRMNIVGERAYIGGINKGKLKVLLNSSFTILPVSL